jgi:prolyl oligopeptidase
MFQFFLIIFLSLSLFAKLPETPLRPVVDEYHGVKVTDNYRWLEDNKSEETIAWTKAQSKHTRAYLDQIKFLPKIKSQLKKWSYFKAPSYYSVFTRGGSFFALKDDPPKNQALVVSLKSLDDLKTEKVLFDPNVIDPTGKTTVDFFEPSYDAKYMAIALSKNGSEVGDLHLYQIADGKKLEDVVPNVHRPTAGGDIAWLPDSTGFFYTRYPQPGERPTSDENFYQQIYFHKIGEPVSSDKYVLGKDFPKIAEIQFGSSPDGASIFAAVANGDGGEYAFFLRDLKGQWKQLCEFTDGVKSVRLGFNDDLYLTSTQNAPKGKILKTSISKPNFKSATVLVPESDVVIDGMVTTKLGFYTVELAGGPSQIRSFDLEGKYLGKLETEPLSSIRGLTRMNDYAILFGSVSYVHEFSYYTYNPRNRGTKVLQPQITSLVRKGPVKFDDIEVKREFATSKDGTKIPLNILYKKGLKKNSKNPTLLYGYGGYGISLSPGFSTHLRLWLSHGGVYVVANIRGGGEFGEEWHLNGNLTKKQNVFDDFISGAEYLIKSKYTSPKHLAIEGRSNGGLLMGAVLTQRPELFRAVVAGVGIYDMLRVELDPNGAFNITEFGTVKNPEQFKAIYDYSPIHHVKEGTAYPAVFITTGANDGRVNPLQSKKMTAALQKATSSKNPILLLVDYGGGHGMGNSRDQWVSDRADTYAFLFKELGMKY